MVVDPNSFICKRPFFVDQKKRLRIFREPHVYLSWGLMLKYFAKSLAKKNYFRELRKTLLRGLMLEPWRPL